ncbi:dockerin type I domain-containing protein [Ruminococcus flavefaciens]|uniref:dockerin type I domain-containing protein n=1 Tax=Ruminococcus flavefaciens TaxID=1265 RepID=UPI000315ADFB|nr:dockerin type I domain-containing protein [Ruminococcus flavefaciens]
MRKIISSIVAITTILTASLNSFQTISKTNAASYRTSYKIYGDLNNDKAINSFDVISMRKAVISGDTNQDLDFNRDDKVDSADLTLLSDYVLGKNSFFDAYLYDDADEDSVCDMLEIAFLQSDPDSEDTDGDTLTDFDEIVYSNTSPTNKNSRGLAVTDAEDDADGDKLTNKEEIANKTNPQAVDSDMDGINDYEELNKYNTDPNNEDSDNDGIIDGDEIKLGLKPDSDKSDGQTPDNQRTFENKIPSSNDLLSNINTEDTPYEVSIDIKSAGNIEKALSIQTGSFSNTSEDDHFIGKSLAISYADNLTVETAKIYFKPDTIEGNIENYMIFEFFPETNYLLPVETKYTSDSAYVETSELGTFTLVKIKDSSQSSTSVKMAPYNILADEKPEISVGKNDVVYDYELGALEVAFFVDISGTLTDNLEETKKSIHDCCQAIFEHSDNAYVEIIGYYTAPDLSAKKLIGYDNSEDDLLLSNIDSVDAALENLSPYTSKGSNDLNYVIWDIETLKDDLFSNDTSQKYVFIISNSDYSFTTSLGYKVTIPTTVCDSFEEIYDSNIHLNFLLSRRIFNNNTAINNLKDACRPYNFGVYSNLENGYFGNSGFARLYSDAITDIYKETIYYITTLTPQSIPKEANRNAFLNSLPYSYDKSKVPAADSNGNINFKDAAVKIGAAYYDEYGNLVFPSMLEVCSKNKLTQNGYEQYMKNRSVSERLISGSLQITPFNDKILYDDTDGDGIPDVNDPYPNKPHDPCFKIVDSFNHIPKLGSSDHPYDPEYVKANEKELYLELYKERFPNMYDNNYKTASYLLSIQNRYFTTRALGNVGNGFILLTDGVCKAINLIPNVHIVDSRNINDAGWFLYYYHTCYGGTVAFDAKDIVENSQSGNEFFNSNIAYLRKACEEMVAKGDTQIISSTDTAGLRAWKNDASILSENALETWLALNECDANMVAKCYFDGAKYHANINYYIQDYYDFYEPKKSDGNKRVGFVSNDEYVLLALFNKAKPFDVVGSYSINISWEKGAYEYKIEK